MKDVPLIVNGQVLGEIESADMTMDGIVGHVSRRIASLSYKLKTPLEEAPIPEDTNELRALLFATSRRMGRLKAELARRQREAQRAERELLEKALKESLDDTFFRNLPPT